MPFEEIQRRGWHLQPNHFYWPLNDVAFLRANPQLWTERRLPMGIEWDLDEQAELLQRLAAYAPELADVPDERPEQPGRFHWRNGTFGAADAFAYYGLVRELQPARVIEVGAGWSSLLLARAVAVNGGDCEVTVVDPYPPWDLIGNPPERWKLVPTIVQDVDLELFDSLEAGDILFYDGSHCVRTGGDVNWMFFEVLPRLAPGVWIHVHDIPWPSDYPPAWVLDEGLSWNEQYLLQAFLMHNDAYHVRFASGIMWSYRHLLRNERHEQVWAAWPPGTRSGTSFWFEKLA